MRRFSDRFAEAAGSCTGLAQLAELLGEAARELGFAFFALLDHASVGGSAPGALRIDNYPSEWVAELIALGGSRDDPVHLASRRSSKGFGWSELAGIIPLEKRHWDILERSRHFGLGDGITIPANVPGEPSASCSFAMRAGEALREERLCSAELVGAHALCAARRLRAAAAPGRPHLSTREVECLRFAAQGKTDWEIATILGLSEHTARQYLKRARAAYGTVSRAQLVAWGLRDGWISFEEAIPPFG